MDDQPSEASIISGINPILWLLLVFFIGLILFELWFYLGVKKQSLFGSNPSQTNLSPTSLSNIFDQSNKETPLNKLAYDEAKAQSQPGEIGESRFDGVVTTKETTDGLALELESKLPNSIGKKIWYRYDSETMKKIVVFKGEGAGRTALSINDIIIGDEVYIDEKNDFSKNYPESIVTVTITKLWYLKLKPPWSTTKS